MATIKDVAREAGVSIATVSRVFNDSGLVSPETERAVRDVASKLNYWPNGVARSLITSRTHTLGVLLPDLHGEFFSGVIRGLDVTARREGFHLLVSGSHSDLEELIAVVRSMRGRVDGLVVMAPDVDTPASFRSWAGDVPIVLIDPRGDIEGYDSVAIANFQGAHAMVRHLIGLGHERIATVTGPSRNVDAQQRLSGYRAALRAAGLERPRELELHGDFTEPSGYEAARSLLELAPRPTAVFVGNDHMAVGVLRALAEASVRVPEDVAVAGFDDIETARYLSPALTTVRVDRFELGARALRRLLHVARLKDRNGGHTHEVLPTALVIRRSCGAELAPRAARWTNPSSEQGQAGLLKRRAAAAPPKSGVAAGAGPAAGRRKPQPKRARRRRLVTSPG